VKIRRAETTPRGFSVATGGLIANKIIIIGGVCLSSSHWHIKAGIIKRELFMNAPPTQAKIIFLDAIEIDLAVECDAYVSAACGDAPPEWGLIARVVTGRDLRNNAMGTPP
jgi:hypothetical protein